jgi:hypothetical protein
VSVASVLVGGGYTIWSSVAPYADQTDATFRKQKLNAAKRPLPGAASVRRATAPVARRSFLETETEAGSDETAEFDAELDAEMEFSQSAEHEVEMETEADVEGESESELELDLSEAEDLESFMEVAATQFDDAAALETIQSFYPDASLLEQGPVPPQGAKPCGLGVSTGFCRKQFTCRTGAELPSHLGGCSGGVCCLRDTDDFVETDQTRYTEHIVAPSRSSFVGNAKIPAATLQVDHRQYMQPIRNQGSCGSCWAHAAIGVLEASAKKQGLPIQPLSPQAFVDCNTADRQAACRGGQQQTNTR